MHNWLIFQYHCERVQTQPDLLRGCLDLRVEEEPTQSGAVSDAGTQEGR